MTIWIVSGRNLYAVIGSIAAAALGYLAFSIWGGWHEVIAAFGEVGVAGMLIALLLSVVNYSLRFVRWQLYLSALGHPTPTAPSGLIYVAGFALTTTPGKAGEMLRGVFLKARGMPYTRSTAAFLSERLSDLLAIVLLTFLGITLYPQGGVIVTAGVIAVGFGLLLLSRADLLAALSTRLANHTGRLARAGYQLLALLIEARRCHTPWLLIIATVLSILAWSAEAFAFSLILHWMGLEVSVPFAFFVYAISMLAGALSFLPGGLGGAEAIMVGLLLWKGIPEAQAVAATVIIRLATLWFAVALGVGALSLGGKLLQPETAIANA
jgi:uncharacterized membrane protein YbhN (UPF0104 family)